MSTYSLFAGVEENVFGTYGGSKRLPSIFKALGDQ